MTKIKKLHFSEVIIPAKKGSINSKGVYKPLHMLPVNRSGKNGWQVQFDELPKLILELHLENGIVGLGEFYRDHNWQVVQSIAESLLGIEIEKLPLKKLPIGLFREYDGFECAIWDAVCKLRKIRLVEMLGGQLQEKVKVSSWSSYRPAKEMGEFAKEQQKKGYDTLKLKCGLEDEVVAWAEATAKKAPKIQLILDPNQRWENFGEARRIVKELEKIDNIFCLEDPIPFWMISEYKELKRFTSIRIVRHVSLPYIYQGQREHHLIEFLREDACDGFNFNGGIAAFSRLEQTTAMANLYCWHGSEIDLGISEARYLHSIAATTHCVWPSDILGRMVRQHDLLKQSLTIKPPFAYLPDGFGLGIELDKVALQKYKVIDKIVM